MAFEVELKKSLSDNYIKVHSIYTWLVPLKNKFFGQKSSEYYLLWVRITHKYT